MLARFKYPVQTNNNSTYNNLKTFARSKTIELYINGKIVLKPSRKP